MAEKRASKSKATPRKRRSVPKKVAEETHVKVEAEAVKPEAPPEPVVAPRVALKELPEELPPHLNAPVEVTLVEGNTYRDRLAKAIFVKGRTLSITDRALVQRCRQSSRFKVGGAR